MVKYLAAFFLIIIPYILNGVEMSDITAGADAYYNYKIWECEIKGGNAELRAKISVTILNSRGMDYNSVVGHESTFEKIKQLKVRLIDAGGNVIVEDDKKDMKKACGFGDSFQIYSEVCTYYKEYAFPSYPFTLEYEYDTDIKSLFLWRGQKFQHYIPVKEASYRLICPVDFAFKYKCYDADIEPSIENDGDKVIYTWKAENIRALEEIDFAPDGGLDGGRISFIAEKFKLGGAQFDGQSWKNVGNWYSQLSEPCLMKETVALSWTPPAANDKISAARAIYDELRDHTRYVSVSIGVGGWKPYEASLTQIRGYGDCKDLSTLLISRLRLAEIPAYPVLALTRGEGLTDLDFPDFNFNHIFVVSVIDDDTLWMDPTCTFCPFGDLPYGDEDINVVIVTDTGGVIAATPSADPEENQVIKESRVFIGADGAMKVNTQIKYYGNYAQTRKDKIRMLDNDETKNYLNDLLPGGERRYKLGNYTIVNLGGIEQPLEIGLDAVGKKKVDELNNVIYLSPNILETLGSSETLDLDGRDIAVDWGYPYIFRENIVITWDTLLDLDSIYIPPNDSVEFALGKSSCRIQNALDTVKVSLSSVFTDYILPVEQFENFENYRSRKKEMLSSYIKLYKKVD